MKMKRKKLLIAVSVMAIILIGLASISYAAATVKTPAEIVAGLTGKSVDVVTAQRQAGVSYGAQAKAADKLEAFQDERLAQYKIQLDALVADGKLTAAEAKDRLAAMTARMEACDGAGTGAASGGYGMGQVPGQGGNGLRDGSGAGQGMRRGGGCGGNGQG
jgi:hypothetical protein